MIRLTLVRQKADTYGAFHGDERIVQSRQPIYDGARALLQKGYPEDTLMTARHVTSQVDSINPTPIGELARWTVEGDRETPMRRRRWRAYPKDKIAHTA